ncbi:vitelline membrane outer layer protein 1 homolog isoform X2 [Macrobrachium rosenbergii]|uniref:vitelline membrane outer layer protein 1 homolog isoform X2 n=1 Tax=Macrobrachium rosenbergii TaxID=79674 RepID=UPI0034D64181
MIGLLILFTVAVSASEAYKPDDFIHALGASHFGYWGLTEACPNGSYASAFEIKLEPEQGAFDDDTSVNAIRLRCSTPDGTSVGDVTSDSMNRGSWTGVRACPQGSFLKGYQLKSENGGHTDNTAANALRMWCSGSDQGLESPGTKWGSWLEHVSCKKDKVICGLMTRVEEDQGILLDDSALNDVRFLCCDAPQY